MATCPGTLKLKSREKIPQGSKKSQPDMGAFMTPNRKLAENASEYTPRNKRKGQESSPIETPGKIPRTDQINRSLFSNPTGWNTVHTPTPSRKRKGPESSPVDSIATPNKLSKTGTTDDWVTVGSPPPPKKNECRDWFLVPFIPFFAFKRAIQISVRLKDVQVLKNLIIPFTLSDFFNWLYIWTYIINTSQV